MNVNEVVAHAHRIDINVLRLDAVVRNRRGGVQVVGKGLHALGRQPAVAQAVAEDRVAGNERLQRRIDVLGEIVGQEHRVVAVPDADGQTAGNARANHRDEVVAVGGGQRQIAGRRRRADADHVGNVAVGLERQVSRLGRAADGVVGDVDHRGLASLFWPIVIVMFRAPSRCQHRGSDNSWRRRRPSSSWPAWCWRAC